jgi:hypothetical protein
LPSAPFSIPKIWWIVLPQWVAHLPRAVEIEVAPPVPAGAPFVGRVADADEDRGWERRLLLREAAVQLHLHDVEEDVAVGGENDGVGRVALLVAPWEGDVDGVPTESVGAHLEAVKRRRLDRLGLEGERHGSRADGVGGVGAVETVERRGRAVASSSSREHRDDSDSHAGARFYAAGSSAANGRGGNLVRGARR